MGRAAALAKVLDSVMDRADRPKLPVGRASRTLKKINLPRESHNTIAAAQALNQTMSPTCCRGRTKSFPSTRSLGANLRRLRTGP
jgi:hypothetical protein